MKDNDVDINIDISLCDDFIEILKEVQPIFEKSREALFMSEEKSEGKDSDDKSLTGRSDIDHQDHYERFSIQPVDFIEENDLNYHQGNIVKYICRYRYKDGIDDLYKALWYLKRLIGIEEDENQGDEDEGGYASGIDLNDFLGFDNPINPVEYTISGSEGAVPEDWYITSAYSFSDFSELDNLKNDDVNSDEGIDPLLTDLKDEKLLELRHWLKREDWISKNDIFEKIDELLEDK